MSGGKEVLNVGIDLGTSHSAISASNGQKHVIESYVGWPVDLVARKVLKKEGLIGNEAVAWSAIAPEPVYLDAPAALLLQIVDGQATRVDLADDIHEVLGVDRDPRVDGEVGLRPGPDPVQKIALERERVPDRVAGPGRFGLEQPRDGASLGIG